MGCRCLWEERLFHAGVRRKILVVILESTDAFQPKHAWLWKRSQPRSFFWGEACTAMIGLLYITYPELPTETWYSRAENSASLGPCHWKRCSAPLLHGDSVQSICWLKFTGTQGLFLNWGLHSYFKEHLKPPLLSRFQMHVSHPLPVLDLPQAMTPHSVQVTFQLLKGNIVLHSPLTTSS